MSASLGSGERIAALMSHLWRGPLEKLWSYKAAWKFIVEDFKIKEAKEVKYTLDCEYSKGIKHTCYGSVLLDVIVKANKNDYADDDDDSDLSAGDIHSDIFSSDEDTVSTTTVAKKRHVKDEDAPAAVKRKKTALSAPSSQDKSAPPQKRQRSNKPIDVKKDEHGNYILPVQLGRVKLLSLGEIIPEPEFYSQTHIFPVGYAIQRFVCYRWRERLFPGYWCTPLELSEAWYSRMYLRFILALLKRMKSWTSHW